MKQALILGLGISGKAACRFLLKQGYRVFAIDDQMPTSTELAIELLNRQEALNLLEKRPLFVPSPGVSPVHPVYVKAIELGLPLVGEIELGLQQLCQPCLGITGTNGKTTVVKCLEHVLNHAGRKAKALGNVGEPLLDGLAQLAKDEIAILELSSYQLETAATAKLDGAVILNITDDHLDRYATFTEYARAKFQIQKLLKPGRPLLLAQELADSFPGLITGPVHTLGTDAKSHFWTDKEWFFSHDAALRAWPKVAALRGLHDYVNSLAVWLLLEPFEVSWSLFCDALTTFQKPAHRIEFVAEIDDVVYINDSKATNPDATIKAVEALDQPVVLIAGGADKQLPFSSWKRLKGKVKKILVFGATKQQIYEQLHDTFEIECYNHLSEIVQRAHAVAQPGEVVLLAPGCSSFDLFRNYAHRGEEFKNQVYQLAERRKSYVP